MQYLRTKFKGNDECSMDRPLQILSQRPLRYEINLIGISWGIKLPESFFWTCGFALTSGFSTSRETNIFWTENDRLSFFWQWTTKYWTVSEADCLQYPKNIIISRLKNIFHWFRIMKVKSSWASYP